jgi:hypothetical protein
MSTKQTNKKAVLDSKLRRFGTASSNCLFLRVGKQ